MKPIVRPDDTASDAAALARLRLREDCEKKFQRLTMDCRHEFEII